jgi:peptidoglycan/LPS O-acetylase OafA/YrhL
MRARPERSFYRADIDGLRAVAVLSVIAFHLSRTALLGGYLGVDLFFVLSGYLITAIIWGEVRNSTFSIARFYDRRIRRIMPALLCVLVATTVAATLILLPTDLMGYGRSLLATLAFAANFYFWRDTDYFSAAAEQKPLLHLWSLGVEEQFYVLFPLILFLVARWWPRRALQIVTALTILSFAANVFAIRVGGNVPAFFLLPTRAWELGVGAMLALWPTKRTPRPATAQLVASLGALLVAGAVLHPIDSYWFFPAATAVVVGSAMVIHAGRQATPIVNRCLAWRPLVFVGLISYSLYLWHWPVIVFGQYYLVRPFTASETLGAVALMATCAIGTWWFVERPFRGSRLGIRAVRRAAALGVVALAAAAASLLWERGLPDRLNSQAAVINQAVDTNYRCPISEYLALGQSRACVMNLPSRDPADADVVLLGNSHAQMYEPVWASILSARGQTGLLVPANGCLPTVRANINLPCIQVATQNLRQIIALARARTVIIGLNWSHGTDDLVDVQGKLLDNRNDAAFASALDDLIDRLRRAGKRVVLIGPIAEPGWDVASTLSRELAFGRPPERPTSLPAADFERRFGAVLRHFERRRDIVVARPDKVQCPADRCYYILDGHSLFSDSNHLATAELPRFRRVFETALPADFGRP